MSTNNNNMNKQDTQKKILIATVLSFAFFIAYDFLYLQPKQASVEQFNKQNATTQQQQTQGGNQAPAIVQNQTNTQNQAPGTNTTVTSDIISVIETKNNIIKIDNLGRISQVTLKEVQYVDADNKQIKNGDLKYKIGKNIYKIDVKGKLMVALRGDIEHCPENMSGFGCRDSIVVQFKRKIPLKT